MSATRSFDPTAAIVGVLVVGLLACPGAPLSPPPESSEATPSVLEIDVRSPEADPVGGARVSQGAHSVRTDPRGFVRIAGRVGDALQVDAPGYTTWQGEARHRHQEIVLERSRHLEVHVRSATGAGMEHALVTVFALDANGDVRAELGEWNAHTDSDGTATLQGMPAGPLRVRASRAEHASATRHVGPDDPSVEIELTPACAIGVQVYDPRGNPASGAEVTVVGSGVWPPRAVEADATGHVTFADIPPGVYEVHARRGAEAATARRGIEVEVGRSAYISLRLQQGSRLAGVVTDDADIPIEGAEVVLTETGIALVPRVARTDATGAFRFEGVLPGTYWVRADAAGHVSAQAAIRPEDAAEPLVLKLPRAATITGVVYDQRDRPVAGVTVHWLGEPEAPPPLISSGSLGVTTGPVPPIPIDALAGGSDDDLPQNLGTTLVPTGNSAVTDASGRFVLDGIRPGSGELLAEGSVYASVRSEAIRLAAGDTHEVTMVMPDGHLLSGRVVDNRGFPIGSVPVELRAESEPWARSRMASDDGTFEFRGVRGLAVLIARPPDLPNARVRVEVTYDTEVEIRLETELRSLEMRVYDPEGFPVPDARVELEGLRADTPTQRSGWTETDGTIHIGALPTPPWRVVIDHPDFAPNERLVREDELGVELSTFLLRGGVVYGRVRSAWSHAPIVAEVRLDDAPARTTDADGSYRFERVPLGAHRIVARAEGWLDTALDVDVESATSLDLELREAATLAIEVVDTLGDAAPRCALRLLGALESTATTDETGHAFWSVPDGVYEVHATHPTAGTGTTARVRATRGERTEVRLVLDGRLAAEAEVGPGRFVIGAPVSVIRRGADIVVERTYARTPLRAGDVLLRIEDERVLSAGQARAMLRGPEGDTRPIAIRRSGGERTLRVPNVRFQLPPM